jgi:hypothetical protein
MTGFLISNAGFNLITLSFAARNNIFLLKRLVFCLVLILNSLINAQ